MPSLKNLIIEKILTSLTKTKSYNGIVDVNVVVRVCSMKTSG